MAYWIEVKARYEKMLENGTQKRVTEPYLVDALSCTEAEARVIEELTAYTSGDLSVMSNKKVNISEVFLSYTGDKFYKVKVNFITIDEKSAVEKKTASYMIVPGDSFKDAYDNFNDGIKGIMADFEIESIAETRYIDVYPVKLSGNDEAAKPDS